jgi:hypothetical protein
MMANRFDMLLRRSMYNERPEIVVQSKNQQANPRQKHEFRGVSVPYQFIVFPIRYHYFKTGLVNTTFSLGAPAPKAFGGRPNA